MSHTNKLGRLSTCIEQEIQRVLYKLEKLNECLDSPARIPSDAKINSFSHIHTTKNDKIHNDKIHNDKTRNDKTQHSKTNDNKHKIKKSRKHKKHMCVDEKHMITKFHKEKIISEKFLNVLSD